MVGGSFSPSSFVLELERPYISRQMGRLEINPLVWINVLFMEGAEDVVSDAVWKEREFRGRLIRFYLRDGVSSGRILAVLASFWVVVLGLIF